MGCGEKKSRNELIRIVKTPGGDVFIETHKPIEGRGAYVCKDAKCVEKAEKRKGLERSFKVHIQKEVYNSIMEEAVKIER